jgi:hypothetical protein
MIVVVVDSLNSALGRSALARQECQASIVLPANEYISVKSLLKKVASLTPSVVLFSFRNVLLDALTLHECQLILSELHDSANFGLLIPDYLELENENSSVSRLVQPSVDFILTTNRDLQTIYSRNFNDECIVQIYHDLIDETIVASNRNVPGIQLNKGIWVGNSTWGQRQGKIDHKGLSAVVMPVTASLMLRGWGVKLIDSAQGPIHYSDVLREMSTSSFLIHASKSEGTGLPILEAALLGCFPVTTDVGIAQELLGHEFPDLIVERNPQDFERVIGLLSEFNTADRNRLIGAAEVFLREARLERIPEDLSASRATVPLKSDLKESLSIRLRWIYRFFRNRFR